MNSNELLDLIGDTKSIYVLAADTHRTTIRKPVLRHRSFKRSYLIAALLALLILLMGSAVILRLNGLKIGTYTNSSPVWNGNPTSKADKISLQGFVGTANYQASKEWQEFLASYDQDGKLLAAADADFFQPPDAYWAYSCYTQEMINKIDTICSKYNLDTLGRARTLSDPWQMFSILGIENIISGNTVGSVGLDGGYYYQNGTFQFDGNLTLTGEACPWPYTVSFQYRSVMKNIFDGVALSVGDIGSYDEWQYTLSDGTEALLAVNVEKALILVDKEDFFVSVNILNPSAGDILYGKQHMDRSALEAIADTFHFSYKPTFDISLEIPSYADYITSYLTLISEPERLGYSLIDLDNNGTEELLLGRDDLILDEVVIVVNDVANSILFGGKLYLCEGSIVERESDLDGAITHTYYRIEEDNAVVMDCIMYSTNPNMDSPWQWSSDGGASRFSWKSITQEEYNAILQKYTRIEWNKKSLAEFPTN